MKILVTGSHGFMGKHLIKKLEQESYDVLSFDIENTDSDLVKYVQEADFIVHLAGVMRPLTTKEFYSANSNLTKKLIDIIKKTGNKTPVLLASSTQAILDNDYGKTKKMCEDFMFDSGLPVYVFRFTNAFGKWGKPNYNSVASTFMYNIANNLDIFIRDPNFVIHFIYVEDIVDTILKCIKNVIKPSRDILSVTPVYDCSIGHLAELLNYFKKCVQSNKHLPDIHDAFELKLFISFMDYLSDRDMEFNFFNDNRGSFEEIYKSKEFGQISINIAYPGVLKGGHYHTYKQEIFKTVFGDCITRKRKIDSDEVIEVEQFINRAVLIEPNYTHDIKNIGTTDSITLMWISKVYNDNDSDTFKLDV